MGYSIISTCPQCETAVSRTLSMLDFDHVWFKVRRRVVYRGRLTLRTMALFPGYIFIQAKQMWAEIERVLGVYGFVRFGGSIEEVPINVINGLKLRTGCDGVLDEAALPFRAGQNVLVRLGGQETVATFRDYIGPAKVLVDVPMMNRVCCVTVRLGELRAQN